MANTKKKGIVYWLEQIFRAIVGGRPEPAAPAVSGETNTEKKGIVYWLERISTAITGASTQEVTDITALTDAQLDALQVGDKVAKKTGTAEHLYTVTYKDADNGGICLTYEDASVIETVSYDHTDGGWVFNSKDVTPVTPQNEHVTVRIAGCVWDGDNSTNAYASVTGGKVVVEAWNPATAENVSTEEFTIPAPATGSNASVVEFDIKHGLHYQVHSEKTGLGASFRLVFTSSLENRTVYLWNCSTGVFKCQNSWLYSDELDGYLGVFPCIAPTGEELTLDWAAENGENNDDGSAVGVLVSTASSSFLLMPNDKSEDALMWSAMNYGRNVPALEEYYETANHDIEAARALAKADFAGALNTDKILDALSDAPAAKFAVSNAEYNTLRYLPSAGELFLIYENKTAINAIVTELDGEGPAAIDNNYYWSSSAYDRLGAWGVGMRSGDVPNRDEDSTDLVVGLSAFHFYY